jgi:hypothetical protein
MSESSFRVVLVVLTFGLFGLSDAFGSLARGQEKKDGPPDEKAMMEAMMKAATPGAAHKKLNFFAGSWECTVKMWADPSKPPSESPATADFKWILGGRYLEEKVAGTFGGMKFEGMALIGYDNIQKRYHLTWIDNFGTGVETAHGKVSDDGKTFTFIGQSTDPLTGKKIKSRDVQKIMDNDNYVSEMFRTIDAGGKEMDVKVMEITCTRKK